MTTKFVTVEEAAKILKVQPEDIWRYIKTERLHPTFLACGEYRLRVSEIQNMLSNPIRRRPYL